ncbi:MAG: hypothetical protein QOK43_3035 [Acidimicrobiaceae bacterium]|nr:hypothetical protein [Acidimicrobiaceae bacterium]
MEALIVSRVQLALNVSDLDAAVDFYSRLFGTEPAKRRPGYANFAIADPPLKLVLMEQADASAPTGTASGFVRLNHLGVEVESPGDVQAATARLSDQGLDTAAEDNVTCCYAVQDKVWVTDPDGAPWEVYTVLADAPGDSPAPAAATAATASACGAANASSEGRCC